MEQQVLYTLIVVIVVIVLYLKNRKKRKEYNNKSKTYNLIIQFHDDSYIVIRNHQEFKKIASWSKYGKYSFRGQCSINKEVLEQLIEDTLGISKELFSVISSTGMYIPS